MTTTRQFIDGDTYKELQDTFKIIDDDNDGLISTQDILSCLLKAQPTKYRKIMHILSEYQGPQTGINLNAFINIFIPPQPVYPPTPSQKLFNLVKCPIENSITAQSLFDACETKGINITFGQCRRLIGCKPINGHFSQSLFNKILKNYKL